jgi:hypothetical protein
MLRVLVSLLIIVFMSACGVDTSSSADETATSNVSPDSGSSDGLDGLDLINPNPVISGSDTNETNSSTGETPNGETPVDTGTDEIRDNSIFDTQNAVYDKNGCNSATYRVAGDASYNGINTGENGSDFFSINAHGLEIRSEHLEGSAAYLDKTWVSLYYKPFPEPKSLNLQGYTAYLMTGVFFLNYDIAWSDTSIAGVDNTVYVQSNKDTKPVCYRLVLNNVVGTLIDVQKVYR